MGREQKRKQAKKEGRNVKEIQKKKQEASELKPKTFLVILGVVVGVFVILYLITALVITKDFKLFNKEKEDTEENNIVDNKILAVDSLKQIDEEYYVYYYDTTEENEDITNITHTLNEIVYRVDLHDGFNNNYVGEPSGIVDSIEDLKVENPTIIKVSSEKIVEFYSGAEEITNAFND